MTFCTISRCFEDEHEGQLCCIAFRSVSRRYITCEGSLEACLELTTSSKKIAAVVEVCGERLDDVVTADNSKRKQLTVVVAPAGAAQECY